MFVTAFWSLSSLLWFELKTKRLTCCTALGGFALMGNPFIQNIFYAPAFSVNNASTVALVNNKTVCLCCRLRVPALRALPPATPSAGRSPHQSSQTLLSRPRRTHLRTHWWASEEMSRRPLLRVMQSFGSDMAPRNIVWRHFLIALLSKLTFGSFQRSEKESEKRLTHCCWLHHQHNVITG